MSDQQKPDPHTWQKATEVANQAEAAVIVGLLRGAGIECRIVQETLGALCGLNLGPLGVISIEVPAAQLETAQAILQAQFDTDEMPAEDADSGECDHPQQ